ncbi:MAG: hypothetical protein WCS17_09685 [Prevotella sp.]
MIIQEFPYSGVITRKKSVTSDNGDTSDVITEIYNGIMDITVNTAEVGSVAQTSNYIVSTPLKDSNGNYITPKKNDNIAVYVYGDTFMLSVNNCIPSQIGGITIYASRGVW